MNSDFILCMRTIMEQSFKLFTSFKLPGVNFTPAVLLFGLASFGLAIILIKGIISVTSNGLTHYMSNNKSSKTESRSTK